MDGLQRQKRRRLNSDLNSLDFLSSLPTNIIEDIMVKLPIKEAVRTSVLSTKWQHMWTSIPHLVINRYIEASVVDRVLQMHHGPIQKFEMEYGPECFGAIDRWLLTLSLNSLKDLCLFNLDSTNLCKVPPTLFACQKLQSLKISCCTIHAPDRCFQGLKLLRTVRLSTFTFVGTTMEQFLSGCPMLESVELFDFVYHGCLQIRALKLKELHIEGEFTDLLVDTPKLISASFHLNFMPHGFRTFEPVNDGRKSKLVHAVGALPNIEELTIGTEFCEYLASAPIPRKLPVTFSKMKKLSIFLDVSASSREIEIALCILQSSPNLKTLHLKLPSTDIIWKEQSMGGGLSFLKTVEVVVIEFVVRDAFVSTLEFAEFILSSAPLLKKLIVVKWYEEDSNGVGFQMKLESLPRLSSEAVIIFGHNHLS